MTIAAIYNDLIVYWNKYKADLENEEEAKYRLGIKDRVDVLTKIQSQLTKAIELNAKINGDIQSGNKVTFIAGSSDPEERERDKRFLSFIESRYLIHYCNKTLAQIAVEFNEQERKQGFKISGTWMDAEEVKEKEKD